MTEDMKKFREMTKPVKFRMAKMALRTLKDINSVIVNNIIYNIKYKIYNILFKYNLFNIKRYNINTKDEVLRRGLDFKRGIQTPCLKVLVSMVLKEETLIDLDYFYRQKKDGSKKIILVMKNKEEKKVYSETFLTDIAFSVDTKHYHNADNLSSFKVFSSKSTISTLPLGSALKNENRAETKEYDLTSLKKLRHKSLIHTDFELKDIPLEELVFSYNYSVEIFKKHLRTLTPNNFLVTP